MNEEQMIQWLDATETIYINSCDVSEICVSMWFYATKGIAKVEQDVQNLL